MTDASLDTEAFLQDVSSEEPCGPNLEYDAAFLALEQEYKGKAETQYGDTITPAVPPEWPTVKKQALSLLERSRDLRIAIPLTRALLHLEGIGGFVSGLALIEGLLEQRWETLHPQLDPEDDNDPLLRINTLSALCDTTSFLKDLRETPLIHSRAYGRFGVREFDATSSEASGSDSNSGSTAQQDLALIDGALMDMEPSERTALCQYLDEAHSRAQRIEQVLTEKVGVTHAIDLDALTRVLKRAKSFIHERLSLHAPTPEAQPEEIEPLAETTATLTESQPRAPRKEGINSREDVLQTLDKLCEYYAQQEPGSPVPLLLQRAKRLVGKSFIEILEDLNPDGLDPIYQISGTRKDD